MPYLSESVASLTLSRKSATALAPAHIQIRPLSRPLTKYGVDVPMRTTFMPATFRNDADAISRTAVRADDIWVIGFPKSGDLVVQELVSALVNEGDKRIPFRERTALLERTSIAHPKLNKSFRPSWEMADRQPSPRVIRTNLPMLLLPPAIWRIRPRIIYVARSANEVAAEYYQEYVQLHGYKGSPSDFAELLTNDLVAYSPYHGHVRDFWELQGVAPNILNIKYASDEASVRRIVEEVAGFLDVTVSEERLLELVDWLRATNEREQAYREDVLAMDGIWKRAPTVDFEIPRLPELNWKNLDRES